VSIEKVFYIDLNIVLDNDIKYWISLWLSNGYNIIRYDEQLAVKWFVVLSSSHVVANMMVTGNLYDC
jgi:hypothetical protein